MADRHRVALTIEGVAYIAFTHALTQPTVEQQIDAVRALRSHPLMMRAISNDPRFIKWLIKNQQELIKQFG